MEVYQEPVEFTSSGTRVHGIWYQAQQDSAADIVAVVCDSFAEEKKCAQHILAQMSRQAAVLGVAALHFDYRGTGDSVGNFADFGPDAWCQDILAAAEYAVSRLPDARVGLIGLRLGATLAAEVAETMASCQWLVLWEPVVDGQRFVRENLQRSRIKAMLTPGKHSSVFSRDADSGQEEIDLDGYRVSVSAQRQLAAVDLSGPHRFAGPVLVVNIAPRPQVAVELGVLAEGYPRGEAEVVVMEPLWSRVGLVKAEELIMLTAQWLRALI